MYRTPKPLAAIVAVGAISLAASCPGAAQAQYPQHVFTQQPVYPQMPSPVLPSSRLGVQVSVVDTNPYRQASAANPQGLPVYGLRIDQVFPGTPAQRAGMERGDVILYVNGARVRNYNDLVTFEANSNGTLNMHVLDINGRGLVPSIAYVGPVAPPIVAPTVVAPSR